MQELENELKEKERRLVRYRSAILQLADSAEPDEENKNKINREHLELLNDDLDPLQYVADNRNHPRAKSTLKTAMNMCSTESLKDSLSSFFRRRDSIPLPYTPSLQILISGKGIDQVHRLPYSMKVYEAQKRLAFFIFGNRSYPIKTGSLEQEFCKIFRLPVGVKFHTQELKINGNITKIYESIKPIIEETSFPLAVLQTGCYHKGYQNYDHEIVKSARELVIGESNREVNWFDLFTSLNNKIVHKMLDDKFFSEDDYLRFIENWSENGKEIGTCFSFGMNKKSRIRQILDRIRQDVVGVVTVGDKCLTVPMKSDSQGMIQISYGTNDYELTSLKLKIEVIPTNLT